MSLDIHRRAMIFKEDRRYDTSDITTSPPKYFFNKVDFSMDVSDICGARKRYQTRCIGQSKRCTNPLDPVYELPSYVPSVSVMPRYTRNSIDNSDIEGSQTTLHQYQKAKTRDHINYNDVDKSTAQQNIESKLVHSTKPPIMRVEDINYGKRFKTKRCGNPLQPRYVYDNNTRTNLISFSPDNREMTLDGGVKVQHESPNQTNEFGFVDGSTTKKPRENALPTFSLETHDIEYCTPMARLRQKSRMNIPSRINATHDILGAQANTANKRWSRQTNPLQPEYQLLERGDPDFNPLQTTHIGSWLENSLFLKQHAQQKLRPQHSQSLTVNPSSSPSSSSRQQTQNTSSFPRRHHSRHSSNNSVCLTPAKSRNRSRSSSISSSNSASRYNGKRHESVKCNNTIQAERDSNIALVKSLV